MYIQYSFIDIDTKLKDSKDRIEDTANLTLCVPEKLLHDQWSWQKRSCHLDDESKWKQNYQSHTGFVVIVEILAIFPK